MRKKTFLFLFSAILSVNDSIAQNFTAVYNFTDVTDSSGTTDPTAVPVATGVVFGGFSAVGVSANSNASNRFSFTGWPTGATSGSDIYSSLTGSVNTAKYYEVTIGVDNSYTLDLAAITFTVRRTATGIRTYVVRSSVDGYTSNLAASIDPINPMLTVEADNVFFWAFDATTANQNGSTITLGGTNYTGLAAPVTFRIYGFNAEGGVGTFSIDNVTFTGTANITTAIVNGDSSKKTTIYPNPSASGVFTINLGNPAKAMVTVYNVLGKTVLTKEINTLSNGNIDLSNEPNGSYFVTLKNDREISTQKVTINK